MALPKRKHSKARRDKSRTHWKLAVPLLTKCPQCAQPMRPHRVCPSCGTYRGRQVVVVAEKQTGESGTP
jgi:large subunit ribosomal protein L32